MKALAGGIIAAMIATAASAQTQLVSEDIMVKSPDPGIEIFVRNKRPASMTAFRPERTVVFAHGAAVRVYSGDPALGELMAMNYRAAKLTKKQRAMLDFAVKITNESWAIEEDDREALRRIGFSDRDIWDIAAVAGFFNMSNRVASATDMRPNAVYHGQGR